MLILTTTHLAVGLYLAIALVTVIASLPLLQLFRRRKNVTYRVQGVPVGWTAAELKHALRQHFGKDDPALETTRVSTVFKEAGGSGKKGVATVKFNKTPRLIQRLGKNEKYPLVIENHSMTLDHSFYSFTVLHEPPRQEDHNVDIVIVPGLSGHAFGSFKAKGSEHMWPRDALPQELDDYGYNVARILIYGYESSLADPYSSHNIGDIAESFGTNLAALQDDDQSDGKENGEPRRPIILIGHSMGGLVIKKALLWLAHNSNEKPRRAFRATRGLVFFGVPHFGMNVESALPIVGSNAAGLAMLLAMSAENSQFLRDLTRDFNRLMADLVEYKLKCLYFFETIKSGTAKKNWLGIWTDSGRRILLVPAFSAMSGGADDDNIYSIHRNHSDLVKYTDQYDDQWIKVAPLLKELVKTVQKTVQKALETACRLSLDLVDQDLDGRRCRELDRSTGTCEWLFLNAIYSAWKDVDESAQDQQRPSSVLLLTGKPGSGKSVLMRAAMEDCAASGFLTLHFFFDGRQGSGRQDQSELGMYKALLLQLLQHLPPKDLVNLTPRVLQQRHDDDDDNNNKSNDSSKDNSNDNSGAAWSAKNLWKAMGIVLDHLRCERLFVFLDALDESADPNLPSLPDFVEAVTKLREREATRSVRLCLSSRTSGPFSVLYGSELERGLDAATVDVAAHNKADIDHLIVTMLQEYRLHKTRPALFSKLVDVLSSRASGVIMWAKLAVQHICSQQIISARADHEILRDVAHLDGKLTSLYQHLLRHIEPWARAQACSLLALMQVSKRPLEIDEIRSMLECCHDGGTPGSLESQEINMVKRIQSLSGGLVECYERRTYFPDKRAVTVRYMHMTVGEFLVQDAGLSTLDERFKYSSGNGGAEAQFHAAALELCLKTLAYELDPSSSNSNSNSSNDNDDVIKIPFASYAVLFWAMHAHQSEDNIRHDNDEDDSGAYPAYLDDCGSYEGQQLVQLFQRRDHNSNYKTFADKDVPNTSRLIGETSVLLFLAFFGCTALVTRHLSRCQLCQSPKAPKRARNFHQAFFLASYRGFHFTAKAILYHPTIRAAGGVNVDARPDGDNEDVTALLSCCVLGHIDTIHLLLTENADPLQRVEGQPFEYPLHAAACASAPGLVNALLRHCRGNRTLIADLLSAQDGDGWTVFHSVVSEGRTTALNILLHEAASEPDHVLVKALTLRDARDDTPYDLAVMYLDVVVDGNSIPVGANEKSLRHAIARFETLMRENSIKFDDEYGVITRWESLQLSKAA